MAFTGMPSCPVRTCGVLPHSLQTVWGQLEEMPILMGVADIEQVQNEKKPFTLRRIRDETTPHDSGEGHRWNRSESNA